MKCFRGVRAAALFVGSVVGAGFATGQEISLFFGGDGVWSLVVASLFMAVCAFAFLDMGARRVAMKEGLRLATDSAVALSSFAVYAAMIAAAEEVLFRLTGMAWLSVPLALAVSFVAGKSVSWVSALNFVAVPLMAAVIVWVGARCSAPIGGAIHPLRALAYGGMNLLFSGALMIGEGERLSLGERITAAVTAGVVIFVMLLFMRRAVASAGGGEMPFLEAASRDGLGTFASLALLLAIVTTMAGCAFLLISRLTALTRDRTLSASLTTLAGFLTSLVGFAPLVAYAYPVVSLLGVAATLAAVGVVTARIVKNKN
ncbi:MAG: hypothetical protein J5765_05025 [Clostridia bacterium]|nr:hypothetical protein [Clostridia bacterium]